MSNTVFVVSANCKSSIIKSKGRLQLWCLWGCVLPGAQSCLLCTQPPSPPTLFFILPSQGNLAWSTTPENLKAIMETAGHVTAVEVQTHSDTGRSKGWA